jgi:hypothetical protein
MKFKVVSILHCFLILASCSTVSKKQIDLVDRALLTPDITILDNDHHIPVKPNKLYFARLDSTDAFKSDHIILSDEIDANGNVFINPKPGIYAVIASERILKNKVVITLFREDLILKTVQTVEAGEQYTFQMRVMDYTDSLFDRTPEGAKYYKRRLNRVQNEFTYFTIGRFFDSIETRKKLEQEKKKAEEVKASIEKY